MLVNLDLSGFLMPRDHFSRTLSLSSIQSNTTYQNFITSKHLVDLYLLELSPLLNPTRLSTLIKCLIDLYPFELRPLLSTRSTLTYWHIQTTKILLKDQNKSLIYHNKVRLDCNNNLSVLFFWHLS